MKLTTMHYRHCQHISGIRISALNRNESENVAKVGQPNKLAKSAITLPVTTRIDAAVSPQFGRGVAFASRLGFGGTGPGGLGQAE